ncbi:hypothetical protein COBT_003917, partial [Conglomerata obtusa]
MYKSWIDTNDNKMKEDFLINLSEKISNLYLLLALEKPLIKITEEDCIFHLVKLYFEIKDNKFDQFISCGKLIEEKGFILKKDHVDEIFDFFNNINEKKKDFDQLENMKDSYNSKEKNVFNFNKANEINKTMTRKYETTQVCNACDNSLKVHNKNDDVKNVNNSNLLELKEDKEDINVLYKALLAQMEEKNKEIADLENQMNKNYHEKIFIESKLRNENKELLYQLKCKDLLFTELEERNKDKKGIIPELSMVEEIIKQGKEINKIIENDYKNEMNRKEEEIKKLKRDREISEYKISDLED